MARKPLIAGNWKMHGSLAESRALVDGAARRRRRRRAGDDAVVPAVRLSAAVHGWLQGSPIALGAQDLADQAGHWRVHGRGLRARCSRRRLQPRDRGTFRAPRAVRRDGRDRCGEVQARRRSPGSCRSCASAKRSSSARPGRREHGHRAASGARRSTRPECRRSRKPSSPTSPCGRSAPDARRRPSRRRKSTRFIRAMIAARDATIAAGLNILYGGSVKGANAAKPVRHGRTSTAGSWAARHSTRRNSSRSSAPPPNEKRFDMLQTIVLVAHVGIALVDHRPRAAAARQGR